MISIVKVSDPNAIQQELGGLPDGLSLFDPILRHEAKEALEAEGEVFVSQDQDGNKNGLFIYDAYESTGSIFTKSGEVFDGFYELKPSSHIFSELAVKEHSSEPWNIWQLDVDKAPVDHRFRHHVTMIDNVEEMEDFMTMTHPGTNPHWVSVALRNGDKCFVVKISNRIVGVAWMTIVGGMARSHSLYVEPIFRRTGITNDIFTARLVYLKARHVHTLINEIAEENVASSGHAKRIGEKVVGKIFLYTNPDQKEQS